MHLEGLSRKETINVSDIDEHEDVAQSIHKIIISNETEYGSVDNQLNTRRTASNGAAFVSQIPHITIMKMLQLHEGKKQISFNFKS